MLNNEKVKYFSHLMYCKNLFFEFTSNFNRKTLINPYTPRLFESRYFPYGSF